MNEALLLMGCVILLCTLMGRYLDRLAVPSLLIFIALGMCFGENGLLRIPFDDYDAANVICSASLIFIMFYGGFGTNLNAARPVVVQSVVLSTLGVAGTAGAVAAFAHLVLGLPWVESFLIGSVISSTDAASVFNILRSKKLALKYWPHRLCWRLSRAPTTPSPTCYHRGGCWHHGSDRRLSPRSWCSRSPSAHWAACSWASWPSGACAGGCSPRSRARPSLSLRWSSSPTPCPPCWGATAI